MSDDYMLSAAHARVCRLLGSAFAIAGLIQAISIVMAVTAPAFLATQIVCAHGGCTIAGAPLALLPDSLHTALAGTDDAISTLQMHLAQPEVRFELMLAQIVISVPLAALFLSVAMALRDFGRRRGHDLARGLPWLRRAAIMALVSVPLVPLGESIRMTITAQAFRPATLFYLSMEFERFVLNLLLALVALAVTWALAAGIKAEHDLAEIV